MEQLAALLSLFGKYGTQLAAFGAAIAFAFTVYRFRAEKSEAHYWKEFEVFHRLVADLVRPRSKDEDMYQDQQAAIVFELRSFPRHAEFTLRMLNGVRESWRGEGHERLMKEIELSIEFLSARRTKKSHSGDDYVGLDT